MQATINAYSDAAEEEAAALGPTTSEGIADVLKSDVANDTALGLEVRI